MIKFDFTSHFIIVLCLMVILVSTLIIINSSVNSKWSMGPLCNLFKGLQSICYATVPQHAFRIGWRLTWNWSVSPHQSNRTWRVFSSVVHVINNSNSMTMKCFCLPVCLSRRVHKYIRLSLLNLSQEKFCYQMMSKMSKTRHKNIKIFKTFYTIVPKNDPA